MEQESKSNAAHGIQELLKSTTMKILFSKLYVNDQDKALKYYTETLGFLKKTDVKKDQYRWLTIVSPQDKNGTELILELNNNPVAGTYQKAIFEQSIPAVNFSVSNIRNEFTRLKQHGVKFTLEPTEVMDNVFIAVFDDTCGNLKQIQQIGEHIET